MDDYLFKEDWPDALDITKSTKQKLEFKRLFDLKYPHGTMILAKRLFGQEKIEKILANISSITSAPELRKIIGGRLVPGQNEELNRVIQDFKLGPLANEERVRIQLAENLKAAEIEKKRVEKEARQAELAREQAIKDEANRIENELREAQLAIKKQAKDNQQEQLKVLIREAGEECQASIGVGMCDGSLGQI
ncbi:hypothetical protein H4Q26_006015 [Puccinia striiformis f. sp. tritici PST-130]|uniref:Uncharacterized protein n=1 Tax=Puccinia striiformis f. sp. tritici PST-78 TaxID=1165861 RepID=A0A0L0UNQ3_9BASI|nr:hypothetical protein H4Q26_006015 [Puccinia striiformis f. sp. tritici PST-130]KNE88389.1 hypothetical protein PSTG_18211 [Puccinia striiformis f. sp. tritici PST-78]